MNQELSERQARILEYIRQVTRERAYPPSVREIGEAVGLSSSSTVHNHLNQLERRGLIKRDPSKSRTVQLVEDVQSVELRRRVQVGLNKGEAKNALARAVFFNRLGELRDRSFENQRYRASGLNLVIAAIILWNTVYLGRAIAALRARGQVIDEELLPHLAPLGWEHINLTGDYTWRPSDTLEGDGYRPLRLAPAVSP